MSKKETAVKSDKRSRRRAINRREALIWNGIVLGTLGVFALIITWYIWVNMRPGPLAGEITVADEGRAHLNAGVTLPAFQNEPPVSGTHYNQTPEWGISATPVLPGTYLHNLGMGGVVVLYHCATPCPDLEQQFKAFYPKVPPDSKDGLRKMLITSYEKDLPTMIVALAWNHQLNLGQFDEAKMLLWYKRFVNQGPEESAIP